MPSALPFATIARFADPRAIVAGAANGIRSRARITVSEAAERHRYLKNPGAYTGPWRNALTPFLVEPMDAMLLRNVALWVLVGPSQWGKSECFLNFILHAAKYRPGDILMFQPTKDLARDFALRRVEKRLIETSKDLRDELGEARGDDTTFSKTFKAGHQLDVVWPTASNFASRSVRTVLIDERDRMPDDIGGEGDPVALAKNRVKIFGPEGLVGVASSPSRMNGTGIVALYRDGTQKLWHVPCLECGEYWPPGFDELGRETLDHFVYRKVEVIEALDAPVIVCPACGGAHEERDKTAMNERGVWLAKGQTIDRDGRISGQAPASSTASYWFCGLLSPFETLKKIADDLCAAERAFEETGEEEKLKTVWNTGLGFRYVSRADLANQVDAAELAARAEKEAHVLGVVPPGVRFLVATVDTQGNRFDVAVWGEGDRAETWLIDRFSIRQVGKVDIAPATHPEHWNVLLDRVIRARYPLADRPGWFLPIASTAIDSNGLPGTTDNAKAFWRHARREGVKEWALTLIRGAPQADAPKIAPPKLESEKTGKAKKRDDVPVYAAGVTRIKDTLINRLQRVEPGPGFVHLPKDLPARYVAELAAERKIDGVWTATGRNETFDLLVYCYVAAWRLKPWLVKWHEGERPVWATPIAPDQGSTRNSVEIPEAPEPGDPPAPPSSPTSAKSSEEKLPSSTPAPAPAVPVMTLKVPPGVMTAAKRVGGFVGKWRM